MCIRDSLIAAVAANIGRQRRRRRRADMHAGPSFLAAIGCAPVSYTHLDVYKRQKLHIGVDSKTGLAHSAVVTSANVHDKHPLPTLLHGQEEQLYGDSAYASQQELIRSKAPKAADLTNQRVRKGSATEELERLINRAKSRVRSRVEHVFGVVKRLWGFDKVRYRGLAKNATRSFVALGLANIFLARGVLYEEIRL